MGQSLCNHNQTYGTLSHKCHGRSGHQLLSLLGYCTVEIFHQKFGKNNELGQQIQQPVILVTAEAMYQAYLRYVTKA